MKLVVQKFGGTSLADLNCIKNVAKIVKNEIGNNNKIVIVVSAMAGVTNSLIVKCDQLSDLESQQHMREYDAALASAEIVTSALLSLQLQNMGLKAQSLQGWQVPLKTNAIHGNSYVTNIDSKKIKKLINDDIIPVITGFQGVNDNGDITTLGKGGSDTSAALLTAALHADRCDIYTDVEGIYSADPRIVHDAIKLEKIHVNELYELCTSGAKILHPRAALAAKRYNFPMRIVSSFNNNSGTTIETKNFIMENTQITAITSNKNLLKIDIEYQANNFNKILNTLNKESISIEQLHNLDTNKAYIVTNLFDKNKCKLALRSLKNDSILTQYSLNSNISTISIIGYAIKNNISLIEQIISILSDNNIEILASNFSDIKISILINDQDNEKVIKLLHKNIIK